MSLVREQDNAVNIASYRIHAQSLADKFDAMPARIDDIECALGHLSKKQPKVLEIGCGSGRDAEAMLPLVGSYVGIDISPELLEIARRRAPGGRFEVADVIEYDFPSGLDAVFAFASLIHLDQEQLASVLKKVERSLSSGGVLFLSLKKGTYRRVEQEDQFGRRIFFTYDMDTLSEIMPVGLQNVFSNGSDFRGQSWFDTIWQKK